MRQNKNKKICQIFHAQVQQRAMFEIELGAHHIYTTTSNLTRILTVACLNADMEDLKAFVKDSGFAEANDQTHCDLTSGYNIDEGRPTTLLCIVQVYGWPHRVTVKREELDGTNSHSEDASVHVLCLKNDKSFKHHQSQASTATSLLRMLSIHRLQTFSLLNSYPTTSLFCYRKQL